MRDSYAACPLACASLVALSAALGLAQTVPNAGLLPPEIIGVANWTTTGSTQANYDLGAFNPVTRILYVADRTNHAVTVIDTRTNTAIGSVAVPRNPSLNGVLIAPDLQQLVVTDGKTSVFVYDLLKPETGPDEYVIPNITSGTDALDYDPLNQTVYVINGSAPYFITGISLPFKTISSQMPLPGSPELMRFNPADGYIYQVITDGDNHNAGAGVLAYDPVANTTRARYLTPNCVPHGIEIDAVSNAALLGCGTNQGQVLMNLTDGTIVKTFTDVTGSDLLTWNPNNRRFYTGSAGNVSTTTSCPADSTKAVPLIGVIEAPLVNGAVTGKLDGVTCSARNVKALAVDPLQNAVYMAARQYPVDAANADSGQPGVLVYIDPAPPAQPPTAAIQSTLSPLAGASAQGTVRTRLVGRRVRLEASPTGLTGGSALLSITTTIGNENTPCSLDRASQKAVCNGFLIGDPVVGGIATLAVDGVPVARGHIALPPGP
jgi:YVTN family beta-propeller protein